MSTRVFYWCQGCRRPLYAASSAATTGTRDWEIDHQERTQCVNGDLMPLSGTAVSPEDLPHATRVLRLFGT
ncbi:hypothetical protein ACWGF3_15890 [Streptomyces xanthophaeus]|uniref:Uncharacterized protein n=1 Tax=Streptomyces xanthophaeus TaxID=67385 RepID=A0A919GRT5_9ACTN|nr:hypothetical protein [Streptomyces xanthophaeus]WST20477.1 hypothetical protein OG264_02570 [Streptomyces xanthophaeus]WST64536.1 hypothetical protein OG605_35790 [Streptomyces xanthophaeus]GHI82771.1 hypothetical protein Sxan_01350 [Streptomyces xanthophaeus]